MANSKDRVTNNLVALGSAAVITVYSAGFIRTRPAAQRFAQLSERRPAPATRVAAETPAPTPTPINRSAPETTAASAPSRPEQAHAAARDSVHETIKESPAPKVVASVKDSSIAPASSAIANVAQVPAVAAPVIPTPAPAKDTSHAAATAPDSATEAKAKFKDGVYLGWGSSRHGDIQAGIEIKNGRIISAFINECMTQYSCSWISMLPGQVIARQSPEVDFVSGATQSTNAFYYAVVDALKKAK